MLTPLEYASGLATIDYFEAIYKKIVALLERAQHVQVQAQTQAHQNARTQADSIAGAQSPRAGARSPARLLAPADIQHIQEILEPELYQKIYRELMSPYLA